QGAADRTGARDQEVVPRAELAGASEGEDRVGLSALYSFVARSLPASVSARLKPSRYVLSRIPGGISKFDSARQPAFEFLNRRGAIRQRRPVPHPALIVARRL